VSLATSVYKPLITIGGKTDFSSVINLNVFLTVDPKKGAMRRKGSPEAVLTKKKTPTKQLPREEGGFGGVPRVLPKCSACPLKEEALTDESCAPSISA